MTTGGKARRGSTYHLRQDVASATASRDALAKATYGRLFDWLVGRISNNLTSARSGFGGSGGSTIGVRYFAESFPSQSSCSPTAHTSPRAA